MKKVEDAEISGEVRENGSNLFMEVAMKMRLRRLWGALVTLVLLCPATAFAGEVANVVLVSDTRKLTGILKWWGNMYNESHLEFTVLTIILIPVTGVLFGLLADLVMSHIGIDLTSREVSED